MSESDSVESSDESVCGSDEFEVDSELEFELEFRRVLLMLGARGIAELDGSRLVSLDRRTSKTPNPRFCHSDDNVSLDGRKRMRQVSELERDGVGKVLESG